MTDIDELESFVAVSWAPVDDRPLWQWCEAHVRLDKTSPIEGQYSTEYMPFVRWVYDRFQDPRTRMLTAMVASQCWKTQVLMNCLAWCVACDPATSMIVMASKTSMDDFVKKRLRPSFANCDALKSVMPRSRKTDGLSLMQFDTMNLITRGSESKIGLQSDPVRRTFCDERKLWRQGAIDDLRKRQRTFSNSIEFSVGNAGTEHDELHADWLKGSQTFFHVNCLECHHSQPIRFGKKATSLFPARDKGGMVWPSNEVTKPGGIWDFNAVRSAVRWECESCGRLHANAEKIALIKTWHAVSRNPGALPKLASVHGSAFYMLWEACDWGHLAVEFLQAQKQLKEHGNIEPLMSFTKETEGEPWQEMKEDLDEGALGRRKGGYHMGEVDSVGKSIRILTADVQSGHLIYVARQHFAGARSRLIEAGRVPDYEGLRGVQVRYDIRGVCVWLDSAYLPMETGRACLLNGWRPMLGDDALEFSRQEWDPDLKEMRSVKSHWKPVEWDPGCGGASQGRKTLTRYSWAKTHYLDRLYLHLIAGRLGDWTIAQNVPEDYMIQVRSGYMLLKEMVDNVQILTWEKDKRRDFADCELMQLVVGDAGNLI